MGVEEMMFFVSSIERWCNETEMDFDALSIDILENERKQSYFYNFLVYRQKEAYFDDIFIAIEQMSADEESNGTKQVDALKAFLRHDREVDSKQFCKFYRWLKQEKMDWDKLKKEEIQSEIESEFGNLFLTKIQTFIKLQNEKNDDVSALDFGVSVQEWLDP